MASKLTLALLVVALFTVLHQQTAAIPMPAMEDLVNRPWIPLTLCVKGTDNCEKLLVTTTDGLEESMFATDVKPVKLHVDGDEDFLMTDVDLSGIPDEKLASILNNAPLQRVSLEELENVLADLEN